MNIEDRLVSLLFAIAIAFDRLRYLYDYTLYQLHVTITHGTLLRIKEALLESIP